MQRIAADTALVSAWPLQGSLSDMKGKADGQPIGGNPVFGEGPGGGRSLELAEGRFVTMGEAKSLDLDATTIELWFRPDFQAGGGGNPCLIAKRSARTRWSIHIWNDYSCIAIWNGSAVARYAPPIETLRRGRWYALTVTGTPEEQTVYIDGVPCRLADGGPAPFNAAAKNLPLVLGAATPGGMELFEGQIANVAIYDKALPASLVAAHVDAMGWQDRRLGLAAAEKELREKQEAERAEKLARLTSPEKLFGKGKQQVYSGEYLEAVRLPLGGIGAGTIQINGKAEREIWQIFNNYLAATIPHSFFAVRAGTPGGTAIVRVLQTSAVEPFEPMKKLDFRGEYPYAWYEFEDTALPVRVSMEAFSPLIPMNSRDSAIPCAIFNLTAENTGNREVEVAFLAAQQNAVGYANGGKVEGRAFAGYGGNNNRIEKQDGTIRLIMTSDKKGRPGDGDMCLAAVAGQATGSASWPSIESLHEDFKDDGTLAGPDRIDPTPAGRTADGALAVPFRLKPGEARTVPFILTWHFPNARHGAGGGWSAQGNMYANWWGDAREVAQDVCKRFAQLSSQTRLYHDTFYAGNLPQWLLDRISSQVAILRSKTCFWSKDGYFGAWEGCCPAEGCCAGNCTHVWHYAQAHARLFPEIGRRMREQVYAMQQGNGALPHRLMNGFGPAADGELGDIMGAYREHVCSADRTWLDGIWPKVQKAMEHAIAAWDPNEDGVLSGAQHNTLDGSLGGSTSWIGTLYLAALEASARMAEIKGDKSLAERYRKIRTAGARAQNETLFNGEYYVQIRDPQPRHDYGEGCSIDQVLGEWWAGQLDIPVAYPQDRVQSALRALVKYNFRLDFHGIRQAPRKFVDEDDAGLQMIQWPEGKQRPNPTILYADEVMTGFEYSAAGAMVQQGMLEEGFMILRAVHDRYDGRLRTGLTAAKTASWGYSGNPFGDDECGKYYARAMSVWSILLACQGFIYDGPEGILGFKPVWQPDDHASFFTGAEGWGLFMQRREDNRQTASIELKYGTLTVRELVMELPQGMRPGKVTIQTDGRQLQAAVSTFDRELRIKPAQPVLLKPDQTVTLEVALRK